MSRHAAAAKPSKRRFCGNHCDASPAQCIRHDACIAQRVTTDVEKNSVRVEAAWRTVPSTGESFPSADQPAVVSTRSGVRRVPPRDDRAVSPRACSCPWPLPLCSCSARHGSCLPPSHLAIAAKPSTQCMHPSSPLQLPQTPSSAARLSRVPHHDVVNCDLLPILDWSSSGSPSGAVGSSWLSYLALLRRLWIVQCLSWGGLCVSEWSGPCSGPTLGTARYSLLAP